ncbi:transcription antitermination protein NusB [Aureibaculum sp. A20]|uniref:Transcription antitermination protein NusB n=1 Tax=Aureibaculum flavum TaxID=2795986 RepID=A0ABS0WLA7_9FLAO|nr:transcription antitermination protein NusB [Aureibaculum flavum]MBJ2172757.1 transcription antitermination protein NusB [Aureibaculum flavum]
MLNRRHLRIKVMQSVYALLQSNSDDIVKERKFLTYSINKIYDLYVLQLNLLAEVRNLAEKHQEIAKKKYLATSEDKNPNRKFIDHPFLLGLKNNLALHEYIKTQKLKNWKEDSEYVRLIWDAIRESDIYADFINNSENTSPKGDLDFISELYKNVIAPNDKLFDYYESQLITWVDDIPFVNTWILKNLKKINPNTRFDKSLLFKDKEDEEFGLDLYKKTVLHHHEFMDDIDAKTPNWDSDRIAEVDFILMKMAMVELIYFPSIPTRVTINEYIEISKDYSTNKSSFFINGVLDKLLKEYTAQDKIKKIGRGLL